MDDELRAIRLLSVLYLLGVQSEIKTRKGRTEWFGSCPICKPKHNKGDFRHRFFSQRFWRSPIFEDGWQDWSELYQFQDSTP